MKTIYKYPLEIADRQTLMLPAGHEILAVATQHGQPCLWVLVDTDEELMPFGIAMYGTGMPCSQTRKDYIGTVQLLNGAMVLHLFAAIE